MIRVERIGVEELPRNWHWLAQLLAPAVAVDPNRGMDGLKAALLDGTMGIASVHFPEGAGLVVVEPLDRVLWVPYVAGSVRHGLRRVMRSAAEHFKTMARLAGCEEIRFGGRDWSGIFPEALPFDDVPHGLRLVL